MSEWALSSDGQAAWKAHIADLMRASGHTLDSLVTAMGLKPTAVSELSRFRKGQGDTLRRWFVTRRHKYIEPFARELDQPADGLLQRLRDLQTASAIPTPDVDWHPAFPSVAAADVRVDPPYSGSDVSKLKSWHAQTGEHVTIFGLPGSGRRTLMRWLEDQGVQARIATERLTREPTDGEVTLLPWSVNQVTALAERLAATDVLSTEARDRLTEFRARVEKAPALASLAETPGDAIRLLAQVAQRGAPAPRALREELLRDEWARFERASARGWAGLVSEDTIDGLLLAGFLAGASDRDAWAAVIEATVPSRVPLDQLTRELDAVASARGPARPAALEALRRRLAGWSTASVLDTLIEAGWLAEDPVLGLQPRRWPLALSRMARLIVREQRIGWFARCGYRTEVHVLLRECAVWGLAWPDAKAELQRAPISQQVDAAHAAVAFVAHSADPEVVDGDAWFVTQWASMLWTTAACAGRIGDGLSPFRWGLSEVLRWIFDGRWTQANDLIRLSHLLVDVLPRFHEPTMFDGLVASVPDRVQRFTEMWRSGPFPPPDEAAADEDDQPKMTPRDAAGLILLHLAPVQCLPAEDARHPAYRSWADGRPEGFFEQAWERAAHAGHADAARLLAFKSKPATALRWVGRLAPDTAQLECAARLLDLGYAEDPIVSGEAIDVLRRFPDSLLGSWILDQTYWPPNRLDRFDLAVRLGSRTLLAHFADFQARLDEFEGSGYRRDTKYLRLSWVDRAEAFVTDRRTAAVTALRELHALGVTKPLRTWALEPPEIQEPIEMTNSRRVRRGARGVSFLDWPALDALLPSVEACDTILASLADHPWVLSGSPLYPLLAEALQTQDLSVVDALLERPFESARSTDVLDWQYEIRRLTAVTRRPPETPVTKVLVAIVLLLWRRLNHYSHPHLVHLLVAYAGEIEPARWPAQVVDGIRRDAIETLVERRDAAILAPLFAYEGELGRVHPYDAPIVGYLTSLRFDEAVKAWILASDPPAHVRDWLDPPPSKWTPSDAYFTEGTAHDRLWRAVRHANDERARAEMRRACAEARAAGALEAETFWSIWLDAPADDLIERWLDRGALFDRPPAFRLAEDASSQTEIRGGWLSVLDLMVRCGAVDALIALVEEAPTEQMAQDDRIDRSALDLPRDPYTLYPPSAANALGTALREIAPPERLVALGQARLKALGQPFVWPQYAPPAHRLAALRSAEYADFGALSLTDGLARGGYAPFFEWLEAELRARTVWSDDPYHFDGPPGWGDQLDLLLRWRRATALEVIDHIEATVTPPPEALLGLLQSWSADPRVALRIRRIQTTLIG